MNTNENEKSSASQEQLILKHLQEVGSITPMVALNKYGCFRLSARIFNLREKGYEIKMRRHTTPTKKVVAEYYLDPI